MEAINKLNQLLKKGESYISQADTSNLKQKSSAGQWSKQEILGHLIDSGINNLQRFTEIQFLEKPYHIRKYNQDQLVIANHYQDSDITEILNCWLSINHRIIQVISRQTQESLKYPIVIDQNTTADLQFLIEDYVNHMAHHLNQIFDD